MPFPFPDALAEFSVETSVLPARNGLHPGGLVNIVTKSGSNDWHGDAFEFVRNGDVNALNYFAVAQDSLKRNQFGGTFGGHIIRDKLFFFGGIQETIVRQDPSGSSAFIPTTAALNGDFSSLDGAGLPVERQAARHQGSADRRASRPHRLHQSCPLRSGSGCVHEVHPGFLGEFLRPDSLRRPGDLRRAPIRDARRLDDEPEEPAVRPLSAGQLRPARSVQHRPTIFTPPRSASNQRPQTFVLGETYAINPTNIELVPLHVRP